MALGEIGLFNPAESTYMRPGAYDEALRANAFKQASYLSAMDQFYEQLDETVREFNATLSFKEAELAQIKGLTEEQIGLSRQQLEINQEQYKSDLALRQEALKAQTEYQTGLLAVKNKELNLASWANYRESSSNSESDKALSWLNAYRASKKQEEPRFQTWQGGGATQLPTSYSPTPQSSEVDYGNIDESSWL